MRPCDQTKSRLQAVRDQTGCLCLGARGAGQGLLVKIHKNEIFVGSPALANGD